MFVFDLFVLLGLCVFVCFIVVVLFCFCFLPVENNSITAKEISSLTAQGHR